MDLSVEALTALVRRYWPSDKESNFKLDCSPEARRFLAAWERELAKMDAWRVFLHELGEALPDFTVGNITATADSCLRCGLYPKAERTGVVVGCVSILAPVYTVYAMRYRLQGDERVDETLLFESFPPEFQTPASVFAQRVEATLGVSALPRHLAEARIPLFVEPREPPETTLFHALFTGRPESVP